MNFMKREDSRRRNKICSQKTFSSNDEGVLFPAGANQKISFLDGYNAFFGTGIVENSSLIPRITSGENPAAGLAKRLSTTFFAEGRAANLHIISFERGDIVHPEGDLKGKFALLSTPHTHSVRLLVVTVWAADILSYYPLYYY